jgi:hypothetical protein
LYNPAVKRQRMMNWLVLFKQAQATRGCHTAC